jgi:thymidylate synthase (FAD)
VRPKITARAALLEGDGKMGFTIESKTEIKVLDHGFVRLVDAMGDDMSVVRAARVSYDAEPRGDGSDAKLIQYLMKNNHTSPFEAVQFTFEVKAPIFVFRQWHRHRTWSYNEVSARYTELPGEFYVPEPDHITTQSTDNKQMRTTERHPYAESLRQCIARSCEMSTEYYKGLLAQGCPRELARGVLPVNTYSRMFATVDLHNLLHFLRLRMHGHAQHEIKVYAVAMLNLIEPIVPECANAFMRTLNQ